jgi:uncharacterized membrane protein
MRAATRRLSVRGWRPAALGALAGLALLLLIVVALGPLLNRIPLHALQLVIGVLLLSSHVITP